MQVECPRCGTRVEKPATGSPVCPSCGYGSQGGAAPSGQAGGAAPSGGYEGQPAGGGQPPPGGYAPPQGGPPRGQEQGLAIASLILGLVGCFVVPLIASVAAIITAVMAKNKIKEDPQRYGGEGMATAGLWLGIVGTVIGVIGLIFWIVAFGLVLTAIGYCEENPDDPDCQEDGLITGGDAVLGPHADVAPEPAWSWAALPLVAVRPRAAAV